MSETDENNQVASSGGSEETLTWENSPIAQVYNPDGTPKENAATALEELGYSEFSGHALRNGQDLFTALKSGKDAFTRASQKSEGITVPTDESSEDDWKAFNKSLGVPETAEDLKVKMWPEDLPEDFQKDEGLADLLAEHAMKNPVLNEKGIQGLASKFIAHQQEQAKKMQEEFQAQADEAAQKVKDGLTVEFGGTDKYASFSNDVRTLATGDLAKLDFKFELGEDGKTLSAENPLHMAMLADAPTLRLLREYIEMKKPAGVPNESTPARPSQEDNRAKAQEWYAQYGVGGWKSQAHLDEYKRLNGMK